MSWQDDLRRLDAELANGLISAEEYRRRSEDLLAAASSAPARSATMRPQPPKPAKPKPPTAVQKPRQRQSRTRPGPSSKQTPPAGRPASQGDRSKSAHFGPPQPDPVSELFALSEKSSGSRRIIKRALVTLAVVVVLAGVAVASFLFHRQPPETTPAGVPPMASLPVTVPAGLAEKLRHLPGQPVTGADGVVPVATALRTGFYSQQQADTLAREGIPEVLLLASSTTDGENFAVVVIPHHSQEDAARTTAALVNSHHNVAFHDSANIGLPAGVAVLNGANPDGTFIRGLYTSGSDTVVIGASTRNDPSGLTSHFQQLAQMVLGTLPAS